MKKLRKQDIILWIFLLATVVTTLWKPDFCGDELLSQMLQVTLSRCFAGGFFVCLIVQNKYSVWEIVPKKWIKTIPCFLIAVNNFPIYSMLLGNCRVVEKNYVLILALECFMVAFFEETAFRGLLLPFCIGKYGGTKLKNFLILALTSVVFGMYHLFNLFEGAGVGGTLLQVGYSSLIGAMCAGVMLATHNVIICVLIHGIYNFCGLLMPTLGAGSWWDTPTVIFTAILSVLTVIHMVWVFVKLEPADNFEKIKTDGF